jgi:hypothetical protein
LRIEMMRDPLYDKISDALADPDLDPRKFERCMADLLRPDFPAGLVPVVGGSDYGMDGSIADGAGEPVPLVCTTSRDVLGNLSRSLDSHVQAGRSSRKVAVATSQALSPVRRRHLEARAREKGFTLLQLFDRPAIVDRLYRNSRWRQELLGIAGNPRALTAVPRTRRPLVELPPVGRDRDLESLVRTSGDQILVGQPGSGKTFLLHHLIRQREWSALFLDPGAAPGEVADAWRDLQPKIVIVDDAHVYREQLDCLISLRAEIDAAFSIVATTWPTGKDPLLEALGANPAVHALELLTRAEIRAILEQMGISGPDNLVRELIDQSSNRPGLAVTLADLILQDRWDEVLDGSALRRTLLHKFKQGAHSLLGVLSLGGDRGMRLDDARAFLDISRAEARETAVELAAVGVLADLGDDILAVWPRPLRWQLVKSVFFEAPRLDHRVPLEKVQSHGDAVMTLLLAKARCGAEMPAAELRELVRGESDLDLWRGLFLVGEDDAMWALDHYPGELLEVAREALRSAPSAALQRVLARATEEAPGSRNRPDVWEVLGSWARESEDPQQDPEPEIERRTLLARAGREFLGRDRSVGTRAIFLALDPQRNGTSLDPASGVTANVWWGLLPRRQLGSLTELWGEVREGVTSLDAPACQQLESTLRKWIHPDSVSKGELPEELTSFMRAFAVEVLHFLASRTAGRPGISARLERLAASCGVTLDLPKDPDFELLYPGLESPALPYREEIAARQESVRRLALEWSGRPPSAAAARLAIYEQEAGAIPGGRLTADFARELAPEVAEPEAWFQAFVERALPELAAPFAERIVRDRRAGWRDHLSRCLRLEPFRFLAAEQVLLLSDPPQDLLEGALRVADALPRIVETLAGRRLVPEPTLRRLLRHPSWKVALAAAAGEWNAIGAGPQSERVREDLRDDWRNAVLRAKSADYRDGAEDLGLEYMLREILRRDPPLALEWLERRLGEPPPRLLDDSAFFTAVGALGREQKEQVLLRLQDSSIAGPLASHLVGRDLTLYRLLLGRRDLERHHLAPLFGVPDEGWAGLAVAALEACHSPEAVAEAAFHKHGWFTLAGQRPLGQWETAFEVLAAHPDPQLRGVALAGLAVVRESSERAAAKRRQVELHGLPGP